MAVQNKFKVFGQVPNNNDPDAIFPTGDEDYESLFLNGLVPNTLAKSQDVLTPLREITVFTVAFFNWLIDQGLTEYNPSTQTGIKNFEDPEVDEDSSVQTVTNLNDAITNIKNALTEAVSSRIASKEPIIDRNNSTKKGFLKYDGSAWTWDQTSYQAVNEALSNFLNLMGTSASTGLMFKKSNDNQTYVSDKPFVYYDSESGDSATGNKVLNLKTFNPNSNN